ncbi:amidase [Paenibacillus sp. BIHB 4019]|uniref:Amidase n=1 Tax=Paenibacillus sp. BIHB 4019 TaxID=1870819 RepID=A0A1B2DH22_9BACL|nr:amidase family protein [Paenibacillus sp. BIHB 4019]ANY66991.1 amidase [Paenibacillus sp. BIHB 4019]
MPNLLSSWKKHSAALLAGALLLTGPLTASTAAAAAVYQEEATKAIELKLGDASISPDKLIPAAELKKLFDQSAKLAGGDATFTAAVKGATITRKDAAVMIAKGLHLSPAAEPYKDVPDKASYASSVGAVMEAKLMLGVNQSQFAPNQSLTYAGAYALAYRIYNYSMPFLLPEATIASIQQAVGQGKLTYKELVQQYLDRIEKYDDQGIKLNAILTINPKALEIAEELDKERAASGIRGPLHGIPVIVKDNYDTNDMPTTAGCLCLKDSIPSEDAEQVAKLKAAGAIILAKANLHEFAFGITTSSSLGGQTLNPYALDHYPGGSSGGTGAAIAANFGVIGMGTDTGGSIRIPSTYNSLVGIRPTIGLSSRDGIIPLALSQDVGGPMTRTVTDAAIVLDATVGYDPDDVATAASISHIPSSYTSYLDAKGLKGARIGVATELFGTTEAEQPTTEVVQAAVKDLAKLGAVTVDITIPNLKEIMAYPSLSGYEFKFQLNEYLAELGSKAPYHSLTEIIASGQFDKSMEASLKTRDARQSLNTEDYKDIVLFRTKTTKDALLKVMADNRLDAIVYPSTTQTAALIGEAQNAGGNNRLSPFSGFPAITVPAGYTAEGLGASIEFLGRDYSEPTLIKLAYSYEQGTKHRVAPVLAP